MNRFSILRSGLLLAALLLLVAGVSFAQTSNGTIAGAVTDKSGAGVPNATVTASSTQLGQKRSTTTDAVGTYRIEALLPGIYVVTVNAQGFAELKVTGVEVKASVTTTVNGVLEVAGVAATVTVEASTGQELQTQSGDLSGTIGKPEILNLPFLSLNPISLVLTQPGVQSVAGRDSLTNGVAFSVNGTRPRANNFLIDGQDNNDNSINGQAFQQINIEAISEVAVLTNSYSAEFGRGGGSVTNVISKGGTNDLHGVAWEINRNSALAAIPADIGSVGGATTNPVDNENIFGFSFGGPIKKNKLFFFGTSQWDRERANAGAFTLPIRLPTAAGVATIQSLAAAGRINGNDANFLINSLGGLRGDPNQLPANISLGSDSIGPRGSVQTGFTIRGDTAVVSNDRQWQVKVDWLSTPNDTLTSRYLRDDGFFGPDFFNFPFNLPPSDTQQGGPSQNFGFSWVHTFSARAVNELRFSFAEINFSFSRTAGTLAGSFANAPAVSIIGSGFPTLGVPTGIDQGRGHKTYQFQDALSYTLGSHTFKMGGDVALLQVRDAIPFNDRGSFTINRTRDPANTANTLFTSLANFLDDFTGASGNISRTAGNPITQPFMPTYAPYIQDTWRLRPNVTLNLGLRFEYWGTIENILQFPAINVSLGIGLPGATFPSAFAFQQVGDKKNFAPRVGLAWTPRFWTKLLGQDKTVIRAGYGIFYDGLFTNILDNTASAAPNVGAINVTGPSRATGCVPGPCPTGTSRGFSDPFGINANTAAVCAPAGPQNCSPSLNPFGTGSTLDKDLRNPLTHQWNLDVEREIGSFIVTLAYVGTRGERLYANQEFNPLNPATGFFTNPNFGFVDPRTNGADSFYHAGEAKVEHKLSHSFFLRGSYTFSRLIDTVSEVFVTSGRSSFAQDPFCQKCERGLSAFHRQHRFAFTYIWELPYVHGSNNAFLAVVKAITRDWSSSGTITFQTGAPETVSSRVDTNGEGRSTNDRPNLADPTKNPWDPARYVIPTSGLGNVGRNTLLAAGRQDWNLSIQRAFKVPMTHLEQQQLFFRAEFFNAFNHPNQGIPPGSLNNPDFGNFQSTAFGGRQIRLWLKYSF